MPYFCRVRPEEFRQLEIVLPESPGVYLYYDRSELLLYVGKAKNLRKRVSSYFRPDLQREGRLRMMIDRIARIDFTLTETEMDALLLENSLIKTYQPRYNIRLKDDKSYPYLVIRNEHFPRIFPTRRHGLGIKTVVAREGEPRTQERRHEPRIADDRGLRATNQYPGVAE